MAYSLLHLSFQIPRQGVGSEKLRAFLIIDHSGTDLRVSISRITDPRHSNISKDGRSKFKGFLIRKWIVEICYPQDPKLPLLLGSHDLLPYWGTHRSLDQALAHLGADPFRRLAFGDGLYALVSPYPALSSRWKYRRSGKPPTINFVVGDWVVCRGPGHVHHDLPRHHGPVLDVRLTHPAQCGGIHQRTKPPAFRS